jgi:putative N6-adenine-specific DNA methylase
VNPASLTGYIVTAPGLESLTRQEAERLGLAVTEVEPGGVGFTGSLREVGRANLWLRTATRVLVRLTDFSVRALGELERKSIAVEWARWLRRDVPLQIRVSSKKSRLYHQKAIAERVGAGLRQAGFTLAARAEMPEDEEQVPAEPSQLIVVRLLRDHCTISLDSSGALLHRRGYRLATAKAPLRETLAAALLAGTGWDGRAPLVDPFCGSGTIPIEAALLARGIAPGRRRGFACEQWPGWDAAAWRDELAAADAAAQPRVTVPLFAADRDAGAVVAARANAERAGVAGDIEFRQQSLSDLQGTPGPGWLVSNPPYGVRIGDTRALKGLYGRLGEIAREHLPGWRLALLLPEQPLERPTGLSWREVFRTNNGGLKVRAVTAQTGRDEQG